MIALHGIVRPTLRSVAKAWLRRHPFVREYLTLVFGPLEPLDQVILGARLTVEILRDADRKRNAPH